MTDVYLRQRWFDPRLSHSNMTEALDLAGKVKIKSKKSQSISNGYTGTPPITRFSYSAEFYLTRFLLDQKPR